jgi:hypothetical protein
MEKALTSTRKYSGSCKDAYIFDSEGRLSFISKLYLMMAESENAQVVGWMPDGESFQILDTQLFQQEVIPKYFKHRNLKSFIRQLNLHDFKKIRPADAAKSALSDVYRNRFFRKDQPSLIAMIKRKPPKQAPEIPKSVDETIRELIEKNKILELKVTQIKDGPKTDVPSTAERAVDKAMDCFRKFRSSSMAPKNKQNEALTQIQKLCEDFKVKMEEIIEQQGLMEEEELLTNTSTLHFTEVDPQEAWKELLQQQGQNNYGFLEKIWSPALSQGDGQSDQVNSEMSDFEGFYGFDHYNRANSIQYEEEPL